METLHHCSYCGHGFEKKSDCKGHEPMCSRNPVNKTCLTCKHQGMIIAETDFDYAKIRCEKRYGHHLDGFPYDGPIMYGDCNHWESW